MFTKTLIERCLNKKYFLSNETEKREACAQVERTTMEIWKKIFEHMSWIQLWNISQMISLTLIVKLRKLVKYFTDESSSIFYQKFSSKTQQDHVSRFSSIRSFNFIVLALSDSNIMRNSSFMKISTLMLHNINPTTILNKELHLPCRDRF